MHKLARPSRLSRLSQVLESKDVNYGFNAATGVYEDLMAAGIIDPAKAPAPRCVKLAPADGFVPCNFVLMGVSWAQVIRCALENATSVAKVFLTSDVVVVDIPEEQPAGAGGMNPMDASGYGL